MIGVIAKIGGKVGAESFGQKLAQLRKAKATSTFSQAQIERLQKLLDGCLAISELRNDIVHSALKLAVIADDQRACFINLRHCASGSQTARLFTLEGLRGLTADMNELAKEIRAL